MIHKQLNVMNCLFRRFFDLVQFSNLFGVIQSNKLTSAFSKIEREEQEKKKIDFRRQQNEKFHSKIERKSCFVEKFHSQEAKMKRKKEKKKTIKFYWKSMLDVIIVYCLLSA